MSITSSTPLICIGGPYHGQVRALGSPSNTMRAVFPQPCRGSEWPGAGDTISCLTTEYERRQVGLTLGSLELTGYCWMWKGIENSMSHSVLLFSIIGFFAATHAKDAVKLPGGTY